jgi:glycerol-3-phosphate acyltransferase PlsY
VGATNLSRAAGRPWGILAFLLDFGKGFLPVLAARAITGARPEWFPPSSAGFLPVLAGLAAMLGHVFPPALKFRGGKGVATGFGVMAALSWPAALGAGAVWLVLFLATRTVSVASVAAAASLPLFTALFPPASGGISFLVLEIFALAAALLIIVRHRANLARLLHGKELKFH